MTEHARKNKMPYYPSFAEVESDAMWPEFAQILAKYDSPKIIVRAREYAEEYMKGHGINLREAMGNTEQDFALQFFHLYKIFYGTSEDDLGQLDRLKSVLTGVRDNLYSYAERRTALIEDLQAAGAVWPQIGALLVADWDALEQHERDSSVGELRETHRNYLKSRSIKKPHKPKKTKE